MKKNADACYVTIKITSHTKSCKQEQEYSRIKRAVLQNWKQILKQQPTVNIENKAFNYFNTIFVTHNHIYIIIFLTHQKGQTNLA